MNHDRIQHAPWVDIAHDLNIYPWPWMTGQFEEVYALDVLEHLDNFVGALEEVWRILKPGGLLHLRVPYFAHIFSHRDPTHKWFCTLESMDYFVNGTDLEEEYGFYSPMRWKKLSAEYVGSGENIQFELVKC